MGGAAPRSAARRRLGRTVAVWGLTYKPGTDTLRRSSASSCASGWSTRAPTSCAHDPAVAELPADVAVARAGRRRRSTPSGARGAGRRDAVAGITARSPAGDARGAMRTASSSTRTAFWPRLLARDARHRRYVTVGRDLRNDATLSTDAPPSSPAPARARAGDRRAYVEAGASVLICARDAATLERARGGARSAAVDRTGVVAARPTFRSADDVDALVEDGARAPCRRFTSSSTTPASMARWGRSKTSTGTPGSRRSRSICSDRCCCAARLVPHFKRQRLRQDRPALRRRRDKPSAALQRVRGVESGGCALRRDPRGRGQRR